MAMAKSRKSRQEKDPTAFIWTVAKCNRCQISGKMEVDRGTTSSCIRFYQEIDGDAKIIGDYSNRL